MLAFLVGLVAVVHAESREFTLTAASNLRYQKNGVLEVASGLPMGATLTIDSAAVPAFIPYRDSAGKLVESTNGFYPSIVLLSVPASDQANFPADKIARLNQTAGGLYLSSLDVNRAGGNGLWIPPLAGNTAPDAVYLKHFRPDGKRLTNNWSAKLKKRFGDQLNRAIPLAGMPPAEQQKWTAIYRELQAAADRTQPTARRYWFLDSGSPAKDQQLANHYSQLFESDGSVQVTGVWNIAVTGTAPRHGFPNAPCAEFMSEAVRQAYARAGYAFSDDFKDGNYLIWSNTAAVVRLAKALNGSGWIPWDAADFQPVKGAIAMHALATTPGHTYMIAKDGGQFIVDNGSPYGRDLYRNKDGKDYIDFMYDIGVFFLPPGIIPPLWP